MSNITIRPAARTDAADLAILDNLAGHSIPLIFWLGQTDSERTEDALALGRERFLDDDGFYNWKKGRVAIQDKDVIGMSMSYIMPEPDDEADAIKENFACFKPLAVYPSGQQKGVGKMLFDDSIAIGKTTDANTMNLIVEDTNEVAYKLYRSYGFEVVAQKDFVPFEGSREINEWLLMSRSLI